MFNNLEAKLAPLFITITLLVAIFIFFLIGSLVRLRGKQIKKEQKLLKALVDERERTMLTISTEIHDNINQILSFATMSLKMIKKYAVSPQEKYILETSNLLDTAIGDLRNISHSLNSGFLKKRGLIASLQEIVKWVNLSRDINCTLEIEGEFQSYAKDTELMIIRIAQEAIQNTLKHAKAKTLAIHLQYEKRYFRMIITDDGKGFAINPESPWQGVGLQSMRERSKIIDGSIEIHADGSGTKVVLSAPVTRRNLDET